jgi:hypothetical protein
MAAGGLDFNDAPRQQEAFDHGDNDRDISDIKRKLEADALKALTHIWPRGRKVGDEFHVGSINGEAGHSLKISLKAGRVGVGADFAGNVVVGDLLDAWALGTRGARVGGVDFARMLEEVDQWLGSPFKTKPAPAAKAPDLGPPTGTWNYTDEHGKILTTVTRYDPPGQKKVFRQWDARRNAHNMPDSDRPLFNLTGIKSESTVVFVEGEKAASSLIALGIPATCSMGGTNTVFEKTSWGPLGGKTVIIWPDADEPGMAYAEKVRAVVDAQGGVAIVMQPPTGKADGWDAADAIAEGVDVKAVLRDIMPAPVQVAARAGRQIGIKAWSAQAFQGPAKPIEWCVENMLPRAKAGLLVAMGDAGKGILTMDLALKVAADKRPGAEPTCMGHRVVSTGSVVILAAEDDSDTVHRRLAALDPDGSRRASGRLYVVPLPNSGGPLPIVKTSSTQGPYTTPEWETLKAELRELPDLALIVLDPLASFVHADINADPAAGAYVTGQLASLATETGACLLLPHHMAKRDKPITSPEEARAAIRGSTAIVDGVRFAYALWHVEETEAKRICTAIGERWERNRVLRGAIVKSNDPADRAMLTFVRNMETGLLVDRSDSIRGNRSLQRSIMLDALEGAAVAAAAAGYPYAKTGTAGVWERRHELSADLAELPRDVLRGLVDELCNGKRLSVVRYQGAASPWLDAPDGVFAAGSVELQPGAYRP